MVDLDFIEIGTSNFDTIIQTCADDEYGISIDAIQYYLDCLPVKSNVSKVHMAITANRTTESIDVYYIPEYIIESLKLQDWFRGCNTIGKYHPLHVQYGLTHLVKKESVPLLNIDEFLIQQNIRKIKYLKLDTEGHDCVILNGLFQYLESKTKEYYPDRIMFETNENTLSTDIDKTIEWAIRIGYVLVSRSSDTLLILAS